MWISRRPKLSYPRARVVLMLATVQHLAQDAAKLAASPLWPLSDTDLTVSLQAAHHAEQAALALQARLAEQAASRGIPAAQGHRNTTRWLRDLLLLDPQQAKDLTTYATVLH